MINAQALSQTLSAMSLPMLQKYASLHRNDPYVVSLALSIANQKKQMMTAQQGEAGQQPMPKVVDSEIAGIAPRATPMPEDVGIGQLPAQNLANMAGGGIVAFDDGGEVPRFQVGGMPSAGTQWEVPGLLSVPGSFAVPQQGDPEKEPLLKRWYKSMQAEGAKYKLAQAQARSAQGIATPADLALLQNIAATNVAVKPDTVDPQSYDAAAFPMPAGAAAPVSGAPGAPVVKTPVARPPVSAAPAAAPVTGIGTPPIKFSDDPSEYLNAIQKLSPTGPVFDPFAAETRAIGAKSVAAAQEQEALRKKQMDELGIAGLKEEERYKKREEKLGKQEGELSGLSMLKAGLAIMSGESPHALVNIGKGAAVGAEDYIKGREKINNARERLDDAYSRLEQARRGETILNQRELAQLSKDVRTAEIQSEKDVVAGARQAYGLARDDAKAAASAYFTAKAEQAKIQSMEGIAGLDRASREKIEGMRIQAQKNIANMLPGEARVAMLLGKGETEKDRLESGLEKLDRLKGNLTEAKIAELYVKHVADQKKALQEPMSPTEFAKVLRSAMFSLKPEVADVDKTRPR